MKILILGGDGYLGWPTAMYLSNLGCQVAVVDNYFRRQICEKLSIPPLLQISELSERIKLWREISGHNIDWAIGDITDHTFLSGCFKLNLGDEGGYQCDPDNAPECPEGFSCIQNKLDVFGVKALYIQKVFAG